mgnify:CR=1 FL=1
MPRKGTPIVAGTDPDNNCGASRSCDGTGICKLDDGQGCSGGGVLAGRRRVAGADDALELGELLAVTDHLRRQVRLADQRRTTQGSLVDVHAELPRQGRRERLDAPALLAHGPEALEELEDDIGEHHRAIVELMASYLAGGHPFPQRTHLSVLFATFQIEIFTTIERWIEFARDEINEWPATQDLGMTPRTAAHTRLLANGQSPVSPESPSQISR